MYFVLQVNNDDTFTYRGTSDVKKFNNDCIYVTRQELEGIPNTLIKGYANITHTFT